MREKTWQIIIYRVQVTVSAIMLHLSALSSFILEQTAERVGPAQTV